MSVEVAGARAQCPHCGDEHPNEVLKCPTTDLVLPLAGRMLAGRFALVRELGTGGMASVWLALNTAVDRLVAIKLIRPEVVRRPETVARFRSEARAAGRIEHPNICQIHDFGSSPIGPYMVMEYLRGCSLAEILAGGRKLPVGVAVAVIVQALAGLAAAHREGIVHRDLKPENVFVHVPENGPARVKLMDFGVSKLTDGSGEIQTQHGALLGTPEYMAPEQVGGAASVDARCDLWAVGAMLYRALTGRLPFKGPTIAATLLELTNTEPRAIVSLAPAVPEALCDVIMACLAKDRDARPADADILAAALAPWVGAVDLAALVESADPEHPAPQATDIEDDDTRAHPIVAAAPAADADSGANATLPRPSKGKRKPAASEYPTLRRAPPTGKNDAIGTVARLADEARALREHDEGAPDDDRATARRDALASKPRTRAWVGVGLVVAVVAAAAVWWIRTPTEPRPTATAVVSPGSSTTPASADTRSGDTLSADAAASTGTPDAASTGPAEPDATDTGEMVVVLDDDAGPGDDSGTTDEPLRPTPSGDAPEPVPAVDPGGTVRVGPYLVLSRPGPESTHSEARKYCQHLADTAHVGIRGWTLPNPTVAKQVAGSRAAKHGRYWTSARYQGRARVLALPKGSLEPEPVDKKRVKALCVARVPRPESE